MESGAKDGAAGPSDGNGIPAQDGAAGASDGLSQENGSSTQQPKDHRIAVANENASVAVTDAATAALFAQEAKLVDNRNILLVVGSKYPDAELEHNFFGQRIMIDNKDIETANPSMLECNGKTVYVCGDLSKLRNTPLGTALKAAARVFIIDGYSGGYTASDTLSWRTVHMGRVPILIHGVGVLYRQFFNVRDVFDKVRQEHFFQDLTESSKPGKAHRTGIYLTQVRPNQDAELDFRLLRCSTNLSGPTGNFRETDHYIVDALNQEAGLIFSNQAPLNHVLAQIYWNTPATATSKMKKARIAAHADKTKDMPRNGIMAFTTFYSQLDRLQRKQDDPFDFGFQGNTSGLTKLHFRLKKHVAARPGCKLKKEFSVILYPDSAFFMPLSTNRLYTHEIRPSVLTPEQLPTRLGYVVRCSATESVHHDGSNFIKARDQSGVTTDLIAMEPATPAGVADLKGVYRDENSFDHFIDYGGRFLFSLNKGDYSKPDYRMEDEFRQYMIETAVNPFAKLRTSVAFEGVCNGRQGTVLVRPDEKKGTPIVRTTTKYDTPAQCFQPIHIRLAQHIRDVSSIPFQLNNALIEVYNNEYAKMGAHSDQAQDLRAGSHIAVYSCYRNPEVASRKLVVESKFPGGGRFEIPLKHNSVVVWNLDTNRRFRHKIVLDRSAGEPPENEWLGVTFRTSGTFVQFRKASPDGEVQAFLADGTPLTLLAKESRGEFYKMRGRENREIDFQYPHVSYTISESDLMPPVTTDSPAACTATVFDRVPSMGV